MTMILEKRFCKCASSQTPNRDKTRVAKIMWERVESSLAPLCAHCRMSVDFFVAVCYVKFWTASNRRDHPTLMTLHFQISLKISKVKKTGRQFFCVALHYHPLPAMIRHINFILQNFHSFSRMLDLILARDVSVSIAEEENDIKGRGRTLGILIKKYEIIIACVDWMGNKKNIHDTQALRANTFWWFSFDDDESFFCSIHYSRLFI